MEKLKEYYEKVVQYPDKKTSTDIYKWIQEDIKNINTWEYRVVTLPRGNDKALEGALNKLGNERWQIVSVFPKKDKLTFVLKRPPKSYLKAIPMKNLLKILSGSDE